MIILGGINRVFVEKKQGLNTEALNLFADLRQNLKIEKLESLRILNCYDFFGIDNEFLDICKKSIFSEPPVDNIFEEFSLNEDETAFRVKLLPGQFDQRADSATQCVRIITGKQNHKIEVSKIYILKGDVKNKLEKIKNYLINPIESMEASLQKPKSLDLHINKPENIKNVDGFIEFTESEILDYHKKNSLAMSVPDLKFIQEYFKNEESRNPTECEIKVIDTYWSDHCRHTTFSTVLENIKIEEGKYKELFDEAFELYNSVRVKPDITLMDMATIGMKTLRKQGKLDNLDESEEINACSIVIDVDTDGENEKWLLMFKNETHNHPTEIEPFGGASTCLGGAIRDPLSGRAYVYQAMRISGSGDPRRKIEETLMHKLPQRKITKGAADGYSSYGNQIGLSTGLVKEIYHEGYVAKRMEVGAVIGAVKAENVVRDIPKAGDLVIVVGGRTGRDGCGGATGSSKEHNEDSMMECGSEVQKGNAPTERKLQRLFRNPLCSKIIKRCNDFGAGGVSVAVSELADGVKINLDKLLKKYEGLNGIELAISESQERMAVVVDKENAEYFIKLAEEENLEAVITAEITEEKRLIMTWRGDTIVDIKRSFLNTNGVTQHADVLLKSPNQKLINSDENLLDVIKDLNICSQKGLAEIFDSTIGAGTVLMPFGGKFQLTPCEVMAAKIPVSNKETNTASIMSYGFDPYISEWSPFHGAVYAVVESVGKIVAAGVDFKNIRLSFQEYFERLGNSPEKWGKPFASLLGGIYAQLKLSIPAIGGKDSMSGTFMDLTVPPTLISFAVNTADVRNIISNEFKSPAHKIVKLITDYDQKDMPNFDSFIKNLELLSRLIKEKKVISAHTIGFGGIGAAVAKMCLGNKIGAEINCSSVFEKNYGSFVLEYTDEIILDGYNFEIIGQTIDGEILKINGEEYSLESIIEAFLSPLEDIFPTEYYKEFDKADLTISPCSYESKKSSITKTARPRVIIPVFPGTNCEIDSKIAFEKAGAEAEIFVINNLTVDSFEKSIKNMAERINQSQIIMFPGGFSAGDEPEGSGKFIAAVFRNPYLKESVMELLNKRDGLILGICNGFQALVKLGLLPYGKIELMPENSPTLTYNKIGRHVSCMVRTKIISNKSPWLYNVKPGDIHTVAVSHGEGRFICDTENLENIIKNNQVATQYVDDNFSPTYDIKFNPNHSLYAIEGITSPDGRIFGKMCHSERIGLNLYKNVIGDYDQKIFKSGVEYFQ